jgi:DHA1 family tetracycline resistance protein-like MFS transporter
LGFAITLPVFPLYAAEQLGATPAQITGVASAFFLMAFLVGPVLGRLSDRVGRRPVLVVSQAGTWLSYILIALAPNIVWVYIARIVDGITAGNFSVAQAYISDIAQPQERAKRLGMTNLGFSLGLSIGPALGGLIAAAYGPRVAFIVGGTIATATILITIFALKESLTPERRAQALAQKPSHSTGSVWELFHKPAIAILLVVFFLSQFAFFSFQTTFVLYAKVLVLPTFTQDEVSRITSYAFALAGACGVVLQVWWIGPLVARFGEKKLVFAANVCRLIAFSLLGLLPFLPFVFAAAPFLALGSGLLFPNVTALQTYNAPERRGQVIGLSQSAASLGSVLGPIVAGFLFERWHPSAPMLYAAALSALALLLTLPVFRMKIERPTLRNS